MNKKRKLILVESEMKSPKGHFLNNLIETTFSFNKKFNIQWILNKNFNSEGTFLPKVKIYKNIHSNYFKRKENKLFYFLEEFFLFFINILQIIYFSLFFLYKNNFLLFLKALKSNYFLLPRYFKTFYQIYIKLKLTNNDHVFF